MRLIAFSCLILGAVPALVHAHGLPVYLGADGSANLHATQKVFWGEDGTFAAFNETQQRFQVGMTVANPEAGIPHGTVLSFNAKGDPGAISSKYNGQALLYWNGSEVTPTDQTLTIIRSGNSIDVTENDTFVAGPVIGAYNSASLDWHGTVNFFLPLDAPAGVYAVGLQVTAPDHTDSETFWVMANVGLTPEQYALGVAALTSAVPEPSSIVMAGMGLALIAGLGWKRSRRVRVC